ncbi:MAG: hypothetical protein LOD88_03355 [Novibacillus thermophilus]
MRHKWDLRIHLLFIVAVLAAVFGFQPEKWLKAEIVVGPVEVYKVEHQREEPLRTSKWTEYEISKVLQSITSMRASSYRQLPESYLLFKFERDITLDHDAVPFPVKQMIVTLPDNQWDQPDMLLLNAQGQWIVYDTSHPLSMLTRDYR